VIELIISRYPTEIFPYSLRAKGLTVEMIAIYGSLVILSFVNPIALDSIGWHYYIVFCVFLVIILATTWFLFPETKGYSLEEIAEIFDGPDYRRRVEPGDYKEDIVFAEKSDAKDAEHVDRAV